jgi:uncharacterized protein (TIGR01777 family)
MQIGLTGASGFLGREVIQLATRRGYEVVAFSRDSSRVVDGTIETRRFSMDEVPDFSGCEAVIHLAGERVAGLWTPGKVRRIRESRVNGTRRVVEGIRQSAHRPEVLVTASATGIYGDAGETELSEASPEGSSFLAETCHAWESEARAAESVCRVARIRFGLILGRRGGALAAMLPLFRWFLGGKIGNGRQWWSWIHVEDAASLLVFAIENLDAQGAINGVAPWPVRNADFTRVLGKVLHRPTIAPAPAFALKLVLRGFARELLDSRRVLPVSASSLGFPFRFPELEPALRDVAG